MASTARFFFSSDSIRPGSAGEQYNTIPLFLDTALSNPLANKGENISCNTWHLLDKFGVEGIDRSVGILGEKVPVNAPTVYNAALHFRRFWDGRAADVEAQAPGLITALKKMGFTNSSADQITVLEQLKKADKKYPALFAAAFSGEGEAPDHIFTMVL